MFWNPQIFKPPGYQSNGYGMLPWPKEKESLTEWGGGGGVGEGGSKPH